MAEESVQAHLARFNADDRIVVLNENIHTVPLAAAALGVEEAQIAKTLAVHLKGTDRVLVIVTKGTARLDNAKFKATFGGKAGFVSSDECQAVTGHPPGGVCPFGLAPGVEVYLDTSLRIFDAVYPAAGAVNNCVKTTMAELEEWTGGTWVDVCRE